MRLTPSQTAGPFVHIGCTPHAAGLRFPSAAEVGAAPGGTGMTLALTLLDAEGAPVTDAMIETWQADAEGRIGPDETGFARRTTDGAGRVTIKAARPGRLGPLAPQIALRIWARGVNRGLLTHVWLEDDPTCPLLAAIPAERRGTVIAADEGGGRHALTIRLGGEDETVFLDAG